MKEKIQIVGTVFAIEAHGAGTELLASVNAEQLVNVPKPKDGQPLMPLRAVTTGDYDPETKEFTVRIGQSDFKGYFCTGEDGTMYLQLAGTELIVTGYDEEQAARDRLWIKSTMPGKVVRVLKQTGDSVASGEAVVILEAMKMESPVAAATGGDIAEVLVSPGDVVRPDMPLVKLKE